MSVETKIQSLISASNTKTGGTDATLTAAIQTLIDGYGGSEAVTEPLSVTQNGVYTPSAGIDGFTPVTVNVAGGSLPTGITGIYYGTYTPATNTRTVTINHGLNSNNILCACIIAKSAPENLTEGTACVGLSYFESDVPETASKLDGLATQFVFPATQQYASAQSYSANAVEILDANSVKFTPDANYYQFQSGLEHTVLIITGA